MTLTEIDQDANEQTRLYAIYVNSEDVGSLLVKNDQEVVAFVLMPSYHTRQHRRELLDVTRQLVGYIDARCPLYLIASGNVI